MTAEEISRAIFYKPATNGKAEQSIKEGAKLIEDYVKEKIKSLTPPDAVEENKCNIEQYLKEKETVKAYDLEQDRLYKIDLDNFNEDLKKYFKDNLIEGCFNLMEFELNSEGHRRGQIIPIEPSMEEDYEGGNNVDISNICKKHNVSFMFPYWVYHK